MTLFFRSGCLCRLQTPDRDQFRWRAPRTIRFGATRSPTNSMEDLFKRWNHSSGFCLLLETTSSEGMFLRDRFDRFGSGFGEFLLLLRIQLHVGFCACAWCHVVDFAKVFKQSCFQNKAWLICLDQGGRKVTPNSSRDRESKKVHKHIVYERFCKLSAPFPTPDYRWDLLA